MTIVVRSRRKKRETILTEFPQAEIIDVTSKGPKPWVKFSPFFPHYDIPVPLWDGKTGACVEAIWQALKVFESAGVDEAMLDNDKMKNIKRTVRRFGRVHGHRRMDTGELLPYVKARKLIYLPAYRFVLEQRLQNELKSLTILAADKVVVLLDYETNEDITNTKKPLSHAGLVKAFLDDEWPV